MSHDYFLSNKKNGDLKGDIKSPYQKCFWLMGNRAHDSERFNPYEQILFT